MCPGGFALLQRLGLTAPQGSGDRTSEVSRGRSRGARPIRLSGTLTRKGRNSRGSHDQSGTLKARTVPGDKPGKWSGK